MIKKTIFWVIVFCVIIRSLTSFPLNNSYPGGTDTSTHLLRILLVQTKGVLRWNYYFEGGNPVLNIYPPFGYIIAGYLSKWVGTLLGYKIVMDTVFLVSVILYYIFLKELKLDDKKIIIALLFFTLIPIHSYYFADGRYPSLLSFVFCLLYWVYLKKYFDKNKTIYFLTSAIFFSFAIITNHTVSFMILLVTSMWSILYKNNLKLLKRISKFILLSLLSFLLSAWWLMPYIVNTLNVGERSSDVSNLLLKPTAVTNYIDEIVFRIMNLRIYQSNYIIITTVIYVIVSAIVCLFSLFEIRNKTNRDFIILSLLIVFLSIVLKFKRIFIFLPVSASIVISYGIFKLQKWSRIIGSIILIVLIVPIMLSFFFIRPNFIQNAYFPKLPKDGRFVYLGDESLHYGKGVTNNYFYFLSAVQENENIRGFYSGGGYSIFYSNNKMHYGNLLMSYMNMSQDDYYEILNEGWVNYVVLDKNSELFDYFNKSSKFNFKYFDDEYSVFEINPKSTYVKINNKSISSNVTKLNDEILINMECKPGYVTIKETYDKNWIAKLNGINIELKENNYGFMTFENNLNEKCLLDLKLGLQKLDTVFLFISIVTYFFALICLLYGFVENRLS